MFSRLLNAKNPTYVLPRWLHDAVISHRRVRIVSLSPVIKVPHANFLSRRKESLTHGVFGSPEPRSPSQRPGVKDDLKDMLKGYTPTVQLQLVEAYRRGFQSNVNEQKRTNIFQSAASLFLRIVAFGLGTAWILYLIRSPERTLGTGFSKIFDSTVASLAENVEIRFSDVQGVSGITSCIKVFNAFF